MYISFLQNKLKALNADIEIKYNNGYYVSECKE